MPLIVQILILSLVVYRVGRFIALDTLIEGIRGDVYRRLRTYTDENGDEATAHPTDWNYEKVVPLLNRKIAELIGCPFCITIWVSAATVVVHHFAVDPLPQPIWIWLAVAAGSLIVWSIVDSE